MSPSEQARADALADAETLLDFAAVYADGRSEIGKLTGLWRRVVAIAELADPDSEYYDAHEHRAVALAHHLARAAFRAVPGLRGKP